MKLIVLFKYYECYIIYELWKDIVVDALS